MAMRTDPEAKLQLAALLSDVHWDDGIDRDTSTTFSSTSTPPTPVATSSSPTPRALSPESSIEDQGDNQVPIVEICSGGDLVLNLRLGSDGHEEGAPNTSGL